ncbi:MAG: IS1380 family transposase [Acidimicrobiales bacterium]
MKITSAVRVKVEAGGSGVVAHVGLHALGSFADRLGLADSLSSVIRAGTGRRPVHDRGKVLVQVALMLAGGGETCADIEHLRCEADLFGFVPSDSTVHRSFHELGGALLSDIAGAIAEVRRTVWERSAVTKGQGPVFLDIDASLVEIHSEKKAGTAPTYKGGFGFHPILCCADATGEALSGLLRPGNAGSNTVTDHVVVLEQALAQLPASVQAGHRPGDGSELVEHPIVVRTDSAGSTAGFVAALVGRNIGFMTVAATNRQIQAAIMDAEGIEQVWPQALCQDGTQREGSAVCELTDLVDLSSWPVGTRLIVRREPLHPGAQRSLFPSLHFRYWGFYADQAGDPVGLDVLMRAHAHVENHIERLKDSGLCRFPFSDFEANANWMTAVMLSADLVRWFQLLCLEGYWQSACPKALRWAIFHAPARIVSSARRRIVRLLDGWPSAEAILAAYLRLELIT